MYSSINLYQNIRIFTFQYCLSATIIFCHQSSRNTNASLLLWTVYCLNILNLQLACHLDLKDSCFKLHILLYNMHLWFSMRVWQLTLWNTVLLGRPITAQLIKEFPMFIEPKCSLLCSQMTTVHTLTPYIFKIYFNTILHSISRPPKWFPATFIHFFYIVIHNKVHTL
jgi:hypothetical protein